MVMFYDEYSSETFIGTVKKYLTTEFVQPTTGQNQAEQPTQETLSIVQSMAAQIVQATTGQIQAKQPKQKADAIVQPKAAQINTDQPTKETVAIVQTKTGQIKADQPKQKADAIVQTMSAQLPKILEMTTFSNHIEILCRCKSNEERMFYILYANKEHLSNRELQRCISNQTYTTLLSSKNNMSKGLLAAYPNAPVMFKDTLFVDFLNLPKKHSESKLRTGLVEHMKHFVLELGKDFIFMDQEYASMSAHQHTRSTCCSSIEVCRHWWQWN